MKTSIVVFMWVFFATVQLTAAEEICPGSDKWPASSGAEELKMHEKDFAIDKAMRSVKFLENDVIRMIKDHGQKKSYTILDYEGFYIGYPNNIAAVKGALLRQAAIIAKNNFELKQLKLQNGTTTREEVSKAEKSYLTAKKTFCDFLRQAEYSD